MKQRKLRRYSIFIEAKLESNDFRVHGVAVNFSYKGVGLCCLTPLAVKSEVLLTFFFNNEQGAVHSESVKGVIRWAKNFGHLQTGGVEFTEELSEDSHFVILSHIEMAKEFEG
jgi:hypothetical protein